MKVIVNCTVRGRQEINIDRRKHKVNTLLDLSKYLTFRCGYNNCKRIIKLKTKDGFNGDKHCLLDTKGNNLVVILPYSTGSDCSYNKFVFSDYGSNYKKVVDALSVLPEEIRSKVSWEFVN